jgi:hypothetical protein
MSFIAFRVAGGSRRTEFIADDGRESAGSKAAGDAGRR